MLDQADVIPYLLRRGLLDLAPVVRGEVQLHDASRRNYNYKLTNPSGPNYLLKQDRDPHSAKGVWHEATIYGLLQEHAPPALRRYLPHAYPYDSEAQVLILELFPDAITLQDYHTARGQFPVRIGVALGQALAALHQMPLDAITPLKLAPFHAVPFMLPRPPFSQLTESSNGTLRLLRTVQQFPAFTELLDTLRDGWRTDALIHADIKWDNCLLVAPPGRTRRTRLKIVDWELAGPGDPCWDVGAIFNDYLTCWLQSIPITGDAPPEQFLQLARYPLDRMQPAIRAFWQAYWQGRGLDPATADVWALRAVRYGAARLLQTVFEFTQFRLGLTGNMICMLQLSLNMLRQPEAAARQLLGLRAATETVA